MRPHDSTFRLFVTLLLAVAVPLCCCNFHSWLGACGPCNAAENPAAVDGLAPHHEHATAHDHDVDHHALRTAVVTGGNECGPSPDGSGHGDDHDCVCNNESQPLTVTKQGLEFPAPILVAIHWFPTMPDTVGVSPSRTGGRDVWVDSRPPTTLLRLHCALIV